jgi:hypothetical protein
MTAKVNIFEALSAINKKDTHYFSDRLDDDQKKAYAPLLVMRWLSGCDDPLQVIQLNEFVNPHVFKLQRHKELLHRLMCASATDPYRRYQYPKVIKEKTTPTAVKVIQMIQGCNSEQARDILKITSNEDVIEMAESLGYEKAELTKLKKELK